MALPPAHRIDHTPVCVLQADSAWDDDLYLYELDVVAKRIEPDPSRPPVNYACTEDHPIWRYFGGLSRFDLSTVARFLRDEEGPVKFTLQRLPMNRWGRVRDLQAQGQISEAKVYAVKYGLASVSGAEIELTRNGTGGALGPADIDRLRELCGDDGFDDLANAVIGCSRALLDAEKKPYASGPGS